MTRPCLVAGILGLTLAVAGVPPGSAGAGEEDPPATPEEAMARAGERVAETLKAEAPSSKDSKEHKVHADAVLEALAILKKQSKDGFAKPAFQSLWNKIISLGAYHSVRGLPDYRLHTEDMGIIPVRIGLPVGRGWSWNVPSDTKDGQFLAEIKRAIPDGRLTRLIKVWVYRWNTTYSGIGGENAKGLAEKDMAADREGMKSITFRSNRVVTARLSRGFPKTSYYEIVGEDESLGPLRRRNYYVKGASQTFNFEVIEIRRAGAQDDPFTKWQFEGDDPELEAVLESMEDTGGKKK